MSQRFWIAVLLCFILVTPVLADDAGVHSINGVPLFIDGAQSRTVPSNLSPGLLDQVKTVTKLSDALRILGPAYVAPDDNLHIAHWHFQDGSMLTLWPQGSETLDDTVSVYPRPDCGVAPKDCKDLVLGRKSGTQQHKHGNSGSNASGGGMGGGGSLLSPFMKMMSGR